MTPTPVRRFEVTVNGQAYLVEVGDLRESPVTVTVNGQPYTVSLQPSDSAPEKARIGEVQPIRPSPAKPAGETGPSQGLRAPMPGAIVSVEVKPGETVAYGQTLFMLEAMKMKSAIRSPRAGVIGEVRVAPGQSVGHGDLLLTFE
jgi:biotin carboxyl carrier protein